MNGLSPPTMFVVFADPPSAREQEFHDWYDTVHGPDALENGSFEALYRYRAVGSGWRRAPFLALWEGRWRDEGEAWDHIRPRAHQLSSAGRVGDIASVVWALMMVAVPSVARPDPRPSRVLTTVQNDWRRPDPELAPLDWWHRCGLDALPPSAQAWWLYSSDPAGRGAGYHLAVVESAAPLDVVEADWQGRAAAGSSPTPPYRTMFGEEVPSVTAGEEPDPAPAWAMHWFPISRLRAVELSPSSP
jgi:hypothetical protein